jgi:hypothetical protein
VLVFSPNEALDRLRELGELHAIALRPNQTLTGWTAI